MERRACIVILAVVAAARAEEIDEPTARAIDADVHGEWIRAVALYERAIGDGIGTALQRARLRLVEREAKKLARDALKTIDDPGLRLSAAAEIALLFPKSPDARRLLERAEKDGVTPDPFVEAIASRSPAQRAITGARLGDSFARGERQIDKALAFLRSSQEEKGFWDCDKHGGRELYDDGVTALALLAFLARGRQALDEASLATVERAVAYLVAAQNDKGHWNWKSQHGIYNTALACQALAEYGLVLGKADPVRAPLERAVKAIAAHQHRGGGYRYDPKSPGDTSVTARILYALQRVRALGIEVPAPATDRAVEFIVSLTDPEFGQIGYSVRGGTSARPEGLVDRFPPEHTEAMTASGALAIALTKPARMYLGRGADLVRCTPPLANYPDYYYWMAATHGLRAIAGSVDPFWYDALVKLIASQQGESGAVKASGPWGPDGGVVYSTAACVLALAGPYSDERQVHPMLEFVRTNRAEVYVPGSSAGTPARLMVEKGDRIRLTDTGWMRSEALQTTVDGRGAPEGRGKPLVKSAPFSCLLARIGEKGKPFRPPLAEEFDVDDSGPLEFLVNDRDAGKNQGGWIVTIQRIPK